MNKYLIISVVVLALLLSGLGKLYFDIKKDRNRISENFEQVQKDNQLLTIKYSEKDKYYNAKLDSVIKANKIKPKQVISATLITQAYKDTTKNEITQEKPQIIVPKEPIKPIESKTLYRIPISVNGECWSMKGEVITRDPETKVNITEKEFNNSAQALIIRKRALGFLWWKKNVQLHVYSDCGETNITKIEYIK